MTLWKENPNYYGDETGNESFYLKVKDWTVTTDAANPTISSFDVPWQNGLKDLYDSGERMAMVTVSSQYDNGFGKKTYGSYLDDYGWLTGNARAAVTMLSPPAYVTLEKPDDGLYQLDGNGSSKNVTLTWKVPNLDTTPEGGGKFELYIAGGALDTPIVETTTGGNVSLNGETYSYTFQVPAVTLESNDPTSYRDSYSITVKAKNNAEATWAYDSYILYVYNRNILDILLDGVDKGGSVTMSNVEKIKGLWNDNGGGDNGSAAIVALQRDIALRNVISVNYGEYAYATLADQIEWKSSNTAVATVNYQQGTLYENIENFSYVSYRPDTDFILSGLDAGSTTVTANHSKLPQIRDSLNVTVETLRDKLFLFQCYPKAQTELTYQVYTDASRTAVSEERTLTSNEKGEAAIYAEYGIAGDIYCKSQTTDNGDTITWLGTIYNNRLVSSEADSTKLQLYPVNTLRLRRAAQAEIYLKNPDGTPYANQQVTFRGGVYRQGVYCTGDGTHAVQFDLENNPRVQWKTGDVPQTVRTDSSGRLTVTMDLAQFKTETLTKEVQAGEKIYYLFQLEYGDGNATDCYPLFLRVDGTLNLNDIAAHGDSIVAWETNNSGKKEPFIAQQTLKYSPSASANVADIRKNTGKVGPSTTFPTAYVTTTVMWWGDDEAKNEGRKNTVRIQDTTGKTPECQQSTVTTYPFTDLVFTENVMTLDDAAMKAWGVGQGEDRNVRAVLSKDGQNASQTIALPFQIVNMIGIVEAVKSPALTEITTNVKSSLKSDAGSDASSEFNRMDDTMLGAGISMFRKDSNYDPEASRDHFDMRLYATSDPTVFRMLYCVSAGNADDIYPDYDDPEDMQFVSADASAGEDGELDAIPNVVDVWSMIKGEYLQNAKNDFQDALATGQTGGLSAEMELGGYFEADVAFNSETGEWECRPISGGFHALAGMGYEWTFNSVVGVVPVTASLNLGGRIEMRLDMQQGHYVQVNSDSSKTEGTAADYLTQLRLLLYIKVFAGVGFDYSVVAFKIGVFGQLNLDFQFEWLNRDYLKDSNKQSLAGLSSTKTDDVIFGTNINFSGSTGIEFIFKFLFISYEKVFCSVGFNFGGPDENWGKIEDIWADNKTINGNPVQRMAMPDGQVMYAIDLGPQMESRDYVDASEQVWMGDWPSFGTFSLDNRSDTLATGLQTGAYSYANPVLTDDGEVMFYLSDRKDNDADSAKDIRNTRVAVSTKNTSGQFQEGARFDGSWDGYGDSNLKVAGDKNNHAAVWVRQEQDYSSGGEEMQMLQMNGTEIYAAIPSTDEGAINGYAVTQLTDNLVPDLAPVVATNGTHTVVAWREVSSSDTSDLTNFNEHDAILFRVYDGTNWGQTHTLYNGTGSGTAVKGLEMAMLADGTAAVVYTLDTNSANNSNTDWETVLALIPNKPAAQDAAANSSEDKVLTFRLTTDTDLDENPQITTAQFTDGERFVVAWHTKQAVGNGESESDIRLAALNSKGELYENMPESVRATTGGTGDSVDANFRLAKNAGNIDDLAILWVDTVSAPADSYTYESLAAGVAGGYSYTGHDVLKAVRFVEDSGSYTLSGTVEVAEMEAKSFIDHFDAYMDGQEVKSVILGTDYSSTTQREVTISDGTNDQTATINVANPVSGMYTATAEFVNQIQETAVMLEYDKLYPNSDIDVQFTIRNTGKDPVTKLEITVDGQPKPVYTSGDVSLNLLPNRDITVTAKIPTGDTIENVDYTIKAAFSNENVELSDTLYLDIPDVGVSKVETVKEADGQRTLRYSLYNALSASLADKNDNWRVQVGFYADQGCTTLLEGTAVQTITDKDDLALIDGGGYSAEITLPVDSYATTDGIQQEIPGSGIPVYVKAWVEAPASARSYDTVYEYYQGNNETSLTLDNLALRRGEDVTVQSEMDNSGDTTKVTVDVLYNKLTGTTSGNLIVTLLDADGKPLEKLQSYTGSGSGLLTLSREGTAEQTFTFSQKGADVKVEFSDLILGENSVELDHVSLTGADVTYDPATKTYTATGAGLTSGILDIAPKDSNATITLSDVQYDAKGTPVGNLETGRSKWTITVTNGGKTETYTLVLNNADPVSGEVPGVSIPVTGVSLNESSLSLKTGDEKYLTASFTPGDATNRGLTWASSNPSVATVDSNGKVTAVGEGTATITVTTADGNFTATCTVTVSSMEMKVEIKEGITEVPEAFKNLENLNTPEKITLAMRTAITQLGVPEGNTAVYDVTLMVNNGTGWKKADANNFPAGGLTVTLPYPAGTDSSYSFKVVHMFTTNDFGKTPGATETPAVTNTARGIRFTVNGLSPISVGWTAPNPTNPDRPGTSGGSGGGSSNSYTVTVTKPEHGKVTASPTSASSGSTVTLTVTPDSGYVLDTLTVTDSRGNEIKLTAQGNSKYTFTMPGRAVTVKATFATLPGDAEKPCDGRADCPSRGFTDVGGVGTWYHEAVDFALRNKLMGGYGNGLFGPNDNLSRAQLAQILYNREGKPAVTGSSPFTDVADNAWYSDAITWAAANGIVSGYGNNLFGPNDNITREQLATILWRYSKSPAATNKELHFNDADEISGYALDAMRWAVENGIMNGKGNGILDPKGLATRAQVAQMLKNFMENQEDDT